MALAGRSQGSCAQACPLPAHSGVPTPQYSVPACLWYSAFKFFESRPHIPISNHLRPPAPPPQPVCGPPLSPYVNLCGQIVQELLCFLYRLASMHKDYAVVLCCLGAKEALAKVLDKHSAELLLACELRDLVTECEKHAQLYSNLTSSILAGCIQVRRLRAQT